MTGDARALWSRDRCSESEVVNTASVMQSSTVKR